MGDIVELVRRKAHNLCPPAQWLTLKLAVFGVLLVAARAQDLSSCCLEASGACRSVCEKMSLAAITSDVSMRDDRIHNIYKFCSPALIDFWVCLNETVQDAMSGSSWWGGGCCSLAKSPLCRRGCTAGDPMFLHPSCRRPHETAFFDCVDRQRVAQDCCSRTQSISCNEACAGALWRSGPHVPPADRERALQRCEGSPAVLSCLTNLTQTVTLQRTHACECGDTGPFNLPCCQESSNLSCRAACKRVLKSTVLLDELTDGLIKGECGPILPHDPFWQCFLKKDSEIIAEDESSVINRLGIDAAKLHCCQKASSIYCKRLCFSTFGKDWIDNWHQFDTECLTSVKEIALAQCIEEVEEPCELGCGGLTYCSNFNARPAELFRSCSAAADVAAHLDAAAQHADGFVTLPGMKLPTKNSTHCSKDVWKSVACALQIQPCTRTDHSSLICQEDCYRIMSDCVDWLRAPLELTAASLCSKLTPEDPSASCISLKDYMVPSSEPTVLLPMEAITSPCAGNPCNSSQMCVINRNCLHGGSCARYSCVNACPVGESSSVMVPVGSWVRVPMPGHVARACYKVCRCSDRGVVDCQPLPCFTLDNCSLINKEIAHGSTYYLECNECVCYAGERVCSRRACSRLPLLTALPCNCPPHYLPAAAASRLFPNTCLAKCNGATDSEIEFGPREPCARVTCPSRQQVCLPSPTVCLSHLQKDCPQYICVNATKCASQGSDPVCDLDGRVHTNPCYLIASGRHLAYWGECLRRCSSIGTVCGVNGITYTSECAAWADFTRIDYSGPCSAVGPITDGMEPKCTLDRIICPELKRSYCTGFTAPGACCPKCGGAFRILYSKKQIDRALYAMTKVSPTVINLRNVLSALQRHIKIAECDLKGYLTVEQEIFVSVESILENPTDLQLKMCVLEAEKLADLINRESPLLVTDLNLSALTYAIIVHTFPVSSSVILHVDGVVLCLLIALYVFR